MATVGPQLGAGELRQVLELLAERTSGAVFVVDRDCTVEYWSAAAERLLGPTPSAMLGQHCLRGVRCAACLSGCALQRADGPHVVDVIAADGRAIHLERHVFPTWSDDGSFRGGIELLVPVRARRVLRVPSAGHAFGGLTSSHLAMVSLFATARRLAPTMLPVHVEATDSGTRREVARAIHEVSGAGEPFRELDGTSLRPADLALQGGTILLDDLPEVDRGMQLRLARTLARSLAGVGARWITASERALEAEVRAGRVRVDLAHLLLPARLAVPGLAERPDDVRAIVVATLAEVGEVEVEVDAMDLLLQHTWPGGPAEVRAVLGYALAQGVRAVTVHDLPGYLLARPARTGADDPFADAEVRRIRRALADAEGNVSRAASALGISRSTLWRKRRKYGI